MKSLLKIVLLALVSFSLVGCATGNRIPSSSLKKSASNNVLYFTKRDSIPKDVIYRPADSPVGTRMVDPAVIGAVADMTAKIVGGAFKTKQNIVLTDTELFVTGYQLDSKDIKNLTDSLKSNIDSAK